MTSLSGTLCLGWYGTTLSALANILYSLFDYNRVNSIYIDPCESVNIDFECCAANLVLFSLNPPTTWADNKFAVGAGTITA